MDTIGLAIFLGLSLLIYMMAVAAAGVYWKYRNRVNSRAALIALELNTIITPPAALVLQSPSLFVAGAIAQLVFTFKMLGVNPLKRVER